MDEKGGGFFAGLFAGGSAVLRFTAKPLAYCSLLDSTSILPKRLETERAERESYNLACELC